jgi:hypothetical protein
MQWANAVFLCIGGGELFKLKMQAINVANNAGTQSEQNSNKNVHGSIHTVLEHSSKNKWTETYLVNGRLQTNLRQTHICVYQLRDVIETAVDERANLKKQLHTYNSARKKNRKWTLTLEHNTWQLCIWTLPQKYL